MDEGGTSWYLFSLSLSQEQHKGYILLRRCPGANPKTSSAAGLDLLYGGPVRECYAAPLFVVMLPPLLRGLMVRYDGC